MTSPWEQWGLPQQPLVRLTLTIEGKPAVFDPMPSRDAERIARDWARRGISSRIVPVEREAR